MTLGRAILYFVKEAGVSLLRSWKVSVLAILAIAISLFMGGIFLLISDNLARLVEEWKRQTRVVVYLDPAADGADREGVRRQIASVPWVTDSREVSAAEARERFGQIFPSMADLLRGWEEEPLPRSFEVSFDPARTEPDLFESWLQEMRTLPGVSMVDDDRDWLEQLETVIAVLRAVGIGLGGLLLGGAILTIASVVRLTAHLYREEIATMRLVGATEFFIRGPFYVEGLLQGLTGALLSVLALQLVHWTLAPRSPASVLGGILLDRFLPAVHLSIIVSVGTLAGLVGAVVSLRRESVVDES